MTTNSATSAKPRPKKYGTRDLLRLITTNAEPKKGLFILGILLSFVATICSLSITLMLKEFIDAFNHGNSGQLLVKLSIVIVLQLLASVSSSFLLSYTGVDAVSKLRSTLWDHIVDLPIPYFDHNRTGELSSRVVNDTSTIFELISSQFSNAINGLISIIGSLILMLMLNLKLTIIILIIVPIMAVIIIPMGQVLARISKAIQKETANLNSAAVQMISQNRLVKAMVAEKRLKSQGNDQVNRIKGFSISQIKLISFLNPILNIILLAAIFIIIVYGGILVQTNALTIGSLVAFLMYAVQMISPLSSVTGLVTAVQQTVGATERIDDILDTPVEDKRLDGVGLDSIDTINFDHVDFGYEADQPVLKDINLDIHRGERIALIGESGSGKTTLVSLLESYYAPTAGTLDVNGAPVASYAVPALRDQIGYVSQEVDLMPGTMRDNLLLGSPVAVTDDRLVELLGQVGLSDWLASLSDGLDTDVGERGLNVSGGQRQRLAIVRALVREPSLLILDEATASLDNQNQEKVTQLLATLPANLTSITIVHRLNQIEAYPRILFMEDGEITGDGDHATLLASHARYRDFYRLQYQHG
ncbi:ABC transporter ATP-binding protein [Lactiplantibacillus fabifermentans]|uniref:Abc transporter, atp-binding and permease protein n=2 Tax=Lactiplantibacillus fabifermentans TaxID=483011 RepID=A0A0R2NQ75_9LACO|nr:ABC transporter ATP-binding protein [Lactiplantibacillus fabifermentans]ETY73699.1 multidrug DMT transporter permease [Lactiplantibacillus fabifermentans T30PCM01]KRO27831.1 abc transporter, atp-binding and permease protein [Lactiplantibacillus fabifermentans DSM 21115]